MEVSSNIPGYMPKMTTTPMYGKKPLKIFFGTKRPKNWVLVCNIMDVCPTKYDARERSGSVVECLTRD